MVYNQIGRAMQDKIFFINYLWDMTPQPEFYPFSDNPLMANQGFLAARDPVALDSATLDIIQSEGRFQVQAVTGVDVAAVLEEAGKIGAGETAYTLKRLS